MNMGTKESIYFICAQHILSMGEYDQQHISSKEYVAKIVPLLTKLFKQYFVADDIYGKLYADSEENEERKIHKIINYFLYIAQIFAKIKLCIRPQENTTTTPQNINVENLEELYYDDGYNSETGEFTKMSKESRELFLANRENKPIHNKDDAFALLLEKYFNEYYKNIAEIQRIADKGYDKIMHCVDELFIYEGDAIRIAEGIPFDSLVKIGENVSDEIIELHLRCSDALFENISLYEKIVECITARSTIIHIGVLNTLV